MSETLEGQQAQERFDAEVKHLLGVPHSAIVRREREYQAKSRQNPHRRGPKPKRQSGGASDPAADAQG